MLSPELIHKANLIFLKSRQKVTDIFSGEFASAFRGRGIEFEEFREYSPGDDVRQIDWNVTARTNKPYVKIFREEREQTLFFIVDFSKSLDFGAKRSKRDVLTELAALLSYATIKSNDKVGLITFTDRVEQFLPSQKGKAHVWRLISTLLTQEAKGQGTLMTEALKFFLQVQKRRSTCFLISDFLTDINWDLLKVAKFKHDLVCIRIQDPMEHNLPTGALMDFYDLEEGTRVALDATQTTASKGLQDPQNLKLEMQKIGIDFLDLQTQDEPVEKLIQFFIQRGKKR